MYITVRNVAKVAHEDDATQVWDFQTGCSQPSRRASEALNADCPHARALGGSGYQDPLDRHAKRLSLRAIPLPVAMTAVVRSSATEVEVKGARLSGAHLE